MRIIYIANARIPTEKAHGIQIMQMCEAFALNDAEVELVLPRRFNHIKQDPFGYYGVAESFKIRKLPCLDLIVLDRYLGRLGFWVESITFNLFAFPYVLFKKADIIYSRDKFFLPLSFFRRNFIFEAHTFPANYFLYSAFLRKLMGMVVIARKLKELFIERGIPSDNILVAPDGVDLEKFSIKESQDECRLRLGLPRDKKIVLYTGHLYQWKGAGGLLEAVRKFSVDNYQSSNYLFIFVGGTAQDIADFEKLAEKLNNVLIVGHRPHQEIPYWLKAADVLCLPNSGKEAISKDWTSPLKLFEFMAAQKPIIASDLPSIREILNKENAILVEPDNPEALARGISTALQNREFCVKISHQAFQDVQNYTWRKRAERILKFINR